MAPTSILFYKEVGHSQEGAKEVTALFGDKGVFDGPKPVRLLQRLLTLANLKDDSIVLDFFSGSASTAHAVMKMKAEERTTERRFTNSPSFLLSLKRGFQTVLTSSVILIASYPDIRFSSFSRIIVIAYW